MTVEDRELLVAVGVAAVVPPDADDAVLFGFFVRIVYFDRLDPHLIAAQQPCAAASAMRTGLAVRYCRILDLAVVTPCHCRDLLTIERGSFKHRELL